MERFIHALNLERYIDLLESETDPAKRELLHRLLVEEVDRFGSQSERLNQADRLIARGSERLREIEVLVSRQRSDGDDSSGCEHLLANTNLTLELLTQYRQRLHHDIGDGRL